MIRYPQLTVKFGLSVLSIALIILTRGNELLAMVLGTL